jgi:hypothetical protein
MLETFGNWKTQKIQNTMWSRSARSRKKKPSVTDIADEIRVRHTRHHQCFYISNTLVHTQELDAKIEAIGPQASTEEKRKEIVKDTMIDLRKHLKTLEDTDWMFEKSNDEYGS